MRLVCISDTHGAHNQLQGLYEVPPGDVLLHAGDITDGGSFEVLDDFNKWLAKQPHTYKIVVAGNHDWCFEHQASKARTILTNATYLQDSGCVLDGVRFWGSPWVLAGHGVSGSFTKLPVEKPPPPPLDTNVLITHSGHAPCLDFGVPVALPFEQSPIRQPEYAALQLHVFGHSGLDYSALNCCLVDANVLEGHSSPWIRVGHVPVVVDLGNGQATVRTTPLQDRYREYIRRGTTHALDFLMDDLPRAQPNYREVLWLDGAVLRVDQHTATVKWVNFTHPAEATDVRLLKLTKLRQYITEPITDHTILTFRMYKEANGRETYSFQVGSPEACPETTRLPVDNI